MKDEPTEKKQQWLLPARKNQSLPTGLYLVATPIGNLGDITLRALDTLAAADVVMCEDTRVSAKLLNYFGLSKKLFSYNDHSGAYERDRVLDLLAQDKVVALVSDAGLPLVSDPGLKLVQACVEAGCNVTSIPGASATLTALQLSGLASDAFSFIGFLPTKSKARRDTLACWHGTAGTLIAFETAPRLTKALADIADVMSDPEMVVARELTKLHEEIARGKASDLLARYEKNGAPRGEIVLVIAPSALAGMDDEAVDRALYEALETMSTKEAAAHVAALSGRMKKELYARALELRK